MKRKQLFYILTLILLLNFFLFTTKSSADWAYRFVVWDGFTYVVSDEFVNEVDKEIGHVTKYSDREGTYSGNFSNTYYKGTKYFSIKGISTDEAIAILGKDGKYIKAINVGEYAGNKTNFSSLVVWIFVLFAVALGVYFVKKKVKK